MSVHPVEEEYRIPDLKVVPILEPITGGRARIVAAIQGNVWAGMGGALSAIEHADMGDAIDARGDVEMRVHVAALIRCAAIAKRKGHYEEHSILVEEIARTGLLIEWDDSEDYHRREGGSDAAGMVAPLRESSRGCSMLLGHAEAQP